jgi:hypothetical protein
MTNGEAEGLGYGEIDRTVNGAAWRAPTGLARGFGRSVSGYGTD